MSEQKQVSLNKLVINAILRWNRERKSRGDVPFSVGCNDQMAAELLNTPLKKEGPSVRFASLLRGKDVSGLFGRTKKPEGVPADLLDKIHAKVEFSKTAQATKSGLWIVRTLDPVTGALKNDVLTPGEFKQLQDGMKDSDDVLVTIESQGDTVVVTQKIGGLLAAKDEAAVSVYKLDEAGGYTTVDEGYYQKGVKFPRKDFIEAMRAKAEADTPVGVAYT